MMKQFKKVLSILCAIALLVSGMTFALAEENTEPAEPIAAQETTVEEAVAEEPVAEEPVAEEPVAEEPAAEEPVVEEPAAEEPAAEEPVVEEPVVEEPVVEEPVVEEPVVEEPQAEEPAAEEPVAEEPAAEEPVAEEPQAEEPAAEEPVAEEPQAEEPADEEIASEENEEVPAEEEADEEEALAEEEASDDTDEEDEDEEDDEEDDGLVTLEENDGYVDQEIVEEQTPAITDEFKGLRDAVLFVGEALTDTVRFGDELTVTLKGCDASTIELQLYVPTEASFKTTVDGKAVSFTPADCDDPTLNLFTYELTNAAGRTHEIVLNAYADFPFQLVAAVKQVEETVEETVKETVEETPAQEDETPAAEETNEVTTEEKAETPVEENNETPAEVIVNDTPADVAQDEQPEETPAPTIQVSVKTYDSLKVGSSISDSLVAGQKAKIQVKCGKNPYVTLTLKANPDDVLVTIDGEAAAFTAAGNGTYTCDLDEVAFRKFAVVVLAKQDLDFTLSASGHQVEEDAAEEAEEEVEETEEESEAIINKEETAEEVTEEPAAETEETAEATEAIEATEETTEETEASEETEETEETKAAEEGEAAEGEEENTEEETEEKPEEEAAEAEPLTEEQLIELGYRKVQILNNNGADIYAGIDAEVIGHADFDSELWIKDNEAEGWAEIYTEKDPEAEEEIRQFIKLAEIEKQPLTEEEIEALGYRKVQILNQNGTDIYDSTEEEAAVISHVDFESELWIKDIEEAEGWAEIFSEEGAQQFVKLAEIEKLPLTDEEIEALGYRKVQILNQNGTDIYDSMEEEAAVIGHVDFESELWIKDIEEVEGWAEVFSDEGAQQFVKLAEIEKQMPSDEEMLEAGYIKVYVAIDIGANIYDSSVEYEGEEPADHLDLGTELWVKLIEGADRAQIYNLDEEAPVRYISLVDIIATMKPEDMGELPTRELIIHSSLEELQVIYVGTRVKIETELVNFLEDDVYKVKWQYSVDGEEYIDIEEANELTYRYIIDKENAHYFWKVTVELITEEEVTAEAITEAEE